MANRSGISSEHDSGSMLAWAVPRAGEKPAVRRAVMATAENRGAVAADIVRHVRGTGGSDAFEAFPQAVGEYRCKRRLPVVT